MKKIEFDAIDAFILLFLASLLTMLYLNSSFVIIKRPNKGIEIVEYPPIPSKQMIISIQKYAKMYKIPEDYLYAVAYQETGFRGPKHVTYNPAQKSKAGALGPMQVMPATANDVHKKKVSRQKLMGDIDFNVMTSAKLIRQLKNRYKDWATVFGYYNTGYPIVNEYAQSVVNKEYVWDNK